MVSERPMQELMMTRIIEFENRYEVSRATSAVHASWAVLGKSQRLKCDSDEVYNNLPKYTLQLKRNFYPSANVISMH